MNIYYVYAYLDTRRAGNFTYAGLDPCFLFEPFYVGKGHGKRMFDHLSRSDRHPVTAKIAKIRRETGTDPIVMQFLDSMADEDARDEEIHAIGCIGRRDLGEGPLVNLTSGGDGLLGWKPSDATRQKWSESRKGREVSDATKRKTSAALRGRKFSLETRRKISDANRRRKVSDETRRRLSESHQGHRHSLKTKRKMSESRSGARNPAFKGGLVADRAWLRKQYVGNDLSLRAVAILAGASIPTVARWLQKHRIPSRSPGRPKGS